MVIEGIANELSKLIMSTSPWRMTFITSYLQVDREMMGSFYLCFVFSLILFLFVIDRHRTSCSVACFNPESP